MRVDEPIFCIGAALIDDSFRCLRKPMQGTSNPAAHRRSAGGVAQNVAHHLARLGHWVELISHFGLDADGSWLTNKCTAAKIGISYSQFSKTPTGHYAAILTPGGDLHIAGSDAHLEGEVTVSFLSKKEPLLQTASLILCACNLSAPCISWIVDFCRTRSLPCVIEPVSVAKAATLRDIDLRDILLITPNEAELSAICEGYDKEDRKSVV